jgi:hypothetical protein
MNTGGKDHAMMWKGVRKLGAVWLVFWLAILMGYGMSMVHEGLIPGFDGILALAAIMVPPAVILWLD